MVNAASVPLRGHRQTSVNSHQVKLETEYEEEVPTLTSEYQDIVDFVDYTVQPVQNTPQKIFRCEICSFQTGYLAFLHKHMRSHKKGHLCSHCSKIFGSLETYNQHLKEVVYGSFGQVQFGCVVCGKQFAAKRYLKTHMDVHRDKRRHQCLHCDRSFTQKLRLTHHMHTYHPDVRI